MKSGSRFPLILAASITMIQAAVFVALAVADFTGLADDRVGLGVGIGLVLLLIGVALAVAAVGVARGAHVARGPVVVTQLIGLGLAWSLRHPDANTGDSRAVGALIAVSALIVLGCLSTPTARRALADDPQG